MDHEKLQFVQTPCHITFTGLNFFSTFDFTLDYIPGSKNCLVDTLSRLPQYNSSTDISPPPCLVFSLCHFPEYAPVPTPSGATFNAPPPAGSAQEPPLVHLVSPCQLASSSSIPLLALLSPGPPEFFVPPSEELFCSPFLQSCTLGFPDSTLLLKNPLSDRIKNALPQDSWFLSHRNLLDYSGNIPLFKGKPYIPLALHPSMLATGFLKTLLSIKRLYWWPTMRKDIMSYVNSCPTCLSNNSRHVKLESLLQPLPISSATWQEISFKFVVDLPTSNGKMVIWTVVDCFSKMAHSVPSALQLAHLFMDHIFCLHGRPKCIVTDMGAQLTTRFWLSFASLFDIQLAAAGCLLKETPHMSGACSCNLEVSIWFHL